MRGASGEAVWSLALHLLETLPCGRILDAGCGAGFLAARLAERGHDVLGADLVDQWRFPNLPFQQVDLDQPLPFLSGSFDAVACVEALGYVESPPAVLREFHRVLRPGGWIVVTIPNILSLPSRIRFLLNGTYRWFPHAAPSNLSRTALADVHRDPLRYTTACFLLERAGFAVERVQFGGLRTGVAAVPIGLVLQALTTLHNAVRRSRGGATPRAVNSVAALRSTHVGILARRAHGAAGGTRNGGITVPAGAPGAYPF